MSSLVEDVEAARCDVDTKRQALVEAMSKGPTDDPTDLVDVAVEAARACGRLADAVRRCPAVLLGVDDDEKQALVEAFEGDRSLIERLINHLCSRGVAIGVDTL